MDALVKVASGMAELVVCIADIVVAEMASTEVMQMSNSIEVQHNVILMTQQNMIYEMALCSKTLLIHKTQIKVL